MALAELRASVAASQMPLLDKLESWIASGATNLAQVDLLRAVKDALSEAQAGRCQTDPPCTAYAQEAASQLELWLRHMASDFGAIDDLASHASRDNPAVHEPRWAGVRSLSRRRHSASVGSSQAHLKSGSDFDDSTFAEVWDDVFDSCA